MDQFDLLKSHIDAYTRKNGSVVRAHDDSRRSNSALPSNWRAAHDHAEELSESAWNGGGASHADAALALRHSAKLHKKAASAADLDGDDDAASHHAEKSMKHRGMAQKHESQLKA